jgi:orotidine-5'-phosphate decarboxylase
MTSNVGMLVNSSRAIIYADQTQQFAIKARQKAKEMQLEMEVLLKG